MISWKFLFAFLIFLLKSKHILSIKCENTSLIDVKFTPETTDNLYANEYKSIVISIHSDCPPIGGYMFHIISNGNFLQISEHTFLLTSDDIQIDKNLSFTINANSIGRFPLEWTLNYINDDRVVLNGMYLTSIIHKDNGARLVFTIAITILVMINNINMGCQLDLQVIKKVLKKPISPSIGFLSQFLIMPFGSYLFGKLYFADNPSWRFGLLTIGCSPGGTVSNFWTLLFNGDVDLSITMTLMSTVAALAMMPLWMFVLGRGIIISDSVKINIPYANLAFSLIGMTIPLAIGLFIQIRKPDWAQKSRKIIRPFTAILLVIAVGGGLYVNFHLLKLFTWNLLAAGMSVAWTGYIFGALSAFLVKRTLPEIIAISIETALQNPGIAFVLLQLSLPQPESDLAAVPIIGQLMMTGPPLWFIYLIYCSTKKLRNKHQIIKDKNIDEKEKSRGDEETNQFV